MEVKEEKLYCSFCGRNNKEVSKLIQGSGPLVFICDKCIELCYDIMIDIGHFEDNTDRGLKLWIDAIEEYNNV